MLHAISIAVGALSGWPAYLLIALLVFGETALLFGFVIPGETALLLGGVSAASGRTSLPLLVIIGTTAAVLGDSVGFEVGRRAGPRLRVGWLGRRLGADRWARGEQLVTRLGGKAVLVARFTAFARAVVPTVSGAARMPYKTFAPWNAAGGLLWVTVALLVGYAAGNSLATLTRVVHWAWVPIVATAGLGWLITRLRKRDQRRSAVESPTDES